MHSFCVLPYPFIIDEFMLIFKRMQCEECEVISVYGGTGGRKK
jgi:hypothetical protein